MNRLRLFLTSALVLSVTAVLATVSKPSPVPGKSNPVGSSRAGALKLEGRLSHPTVHVAGSELYAEYTVSLDEDLAAPTDQPISLALVMDRSGSMSGAKMEDAKRAAHELVDLLDERDELTFITFSDNVENTALLRMTDDNKAVVHASINRVAASGSTFLSGGVEAGWRALRGASGARRMVVVSDGQPTAGLVDEPSLANLVGLVHNDAITVTTLGVGAEYDGMLMQHLSERGGGMYGYLRDGSVLQEVLRKEVAAARTSSVRNVELVLAPTGFDIVEVPGRHTVKWGSGVVLHLADLRPGLPTRVLVRLQSRSAEPEAELGLGATLRWRPLGGEVLSSDVAMSARAIDDLDAVTSSREETLWSKGVAAAGSVRMVAAAAAYERGDSAGASSLLDSAKALFGTSADALAGQTEVDSMRRDYGSASSSQRKVLSRELEKKKLTDFGRGNEGY